MRKVVLISTAIFLTACANAPTDMSRTNSSNGNGICANTSSNTSAGISMNEAVVLPNASNDIDSVSAEYAWIRKNMPACIIKSQTIINKNKKVYRLIMVTSIEHKDRPVYFDITSFYGVFNK